MPCVEDRIGENVAQLGLRVRRAGHIRSIDSKYRLGDILVEPGGKKLRSYRMPILRRETVTEHVYWLELLRMKPDRIQIIRKIKIIRQFRCRLLNFHCQRISLDNQRQGYYFGELNGEQWPNLMRQCPSVL